MKWLKFLKAARKRALEGGAETGAADDGSPHKHSKRRSMQHDRKERTSIEQWHEARKNRTSIDICTAFNVTTTERLSVCKAGITLLINRTYIVIKHLGSGSSGQVKLAFNLRSKKLVAIKAVRKASCGGVGSHGMLGARDARSYDGRNSHGSLGGGGGLTASHTVGVLTCGLGASSCGPAGGGGNGGGGRGWRSITPSSFLLRRSNSSGLGSSIANGSSIRGRSPPASSPSPPPLRCYPGTQNTSAGGDAAASSEAEDVSGPVEDFVREIAILKRLSHPNIVQLVEVIDDPGSDCLLLVMGYVEGSTLQPQQVQPGRWRTVPEELVWRYTRDVLCGLEYLHCHGVVHGDLKPANFIQESLTGVVRILDFGSAVLHGRVVGEEGLRGAHVPMSCTPGFRSPESLAAGYRPSFELDMWALGVCLYLWTFGELPFKGSAPFVVYENIRSAPLVIPTITRISLQLTDLMTRLLDKNPATRMTVHEAVVHPWTTAQGLAPLRTPSPHVMAARVQLGIHLASTAVTGSQAARGSAAFLEATSENPDQQKQESWPQGPTHVDDHRCTATATAAVGAAMTENASSLMLRQPAGSAAGTGNAVPTPPLLSCSSSSANLSTSVADAAAAAADVLLDPVRRGSTPVPAAAAAPSAGPDGPMELWTAAAAAAAAPLPQPAATDRPWRMSVTTTPTVQSPARSLTGMAATSYMSPTALSPFAGWPMPRIAESGSTGNTGSLSPGLAVAIAAGGSTGMRRNSSEVWELRRSVTDEELQAAISSCCDPNGSAAVLMESIFSEVTFPAKQQIICAGDSLDRIYLITAGEVEIYHDLMQDGPDAPCPHKPIIEGLSDPESELDDPGAFLNIRLPGSNVPQLERLSTGLLNITAGGDRSNHGVSHAAAAMAAAFGSAAGGNVPSPGPSAPASASGYTPAPPLVASPCVTGTGAYVGSSATRAANSSRATLTGLGIGVAAAAGGKGSGGREPSGSSIGLFSRAGTQTGHLIVALKGPGDSLGFAGMLPGGSSSGGGAAASPWTPGVGGAATRQPVWSANVRARTQVTAFVASIESLHKLARAHPQVEPLLQQMAVQQETDLAVAEAMRSLRLVGGAIARGAAAATTSTAAGASASESAGPPSASAGASASVAASGNAADIVTAVMPGAVGAAASVAHVGGAGAGGGVSSEGECESCGTRAVGGTELMAEESPGGVMPQMLVASMPEWSRQPSNSLAEQKIACGTWSSVVGGGGSTSTVTITGAGGAGVTYGMVESNDNVEDFEDVVMISSEIL
ncbi:hypothetical protein VaNZ11_014623 [Volvox africanus]|uniref:cGMP-dependent protein kinase n=1 Tax=Volvox africanus TaxID=51714 RepID=A0ABQ5SK16_9CHLO|nr:hypothetical protein VaNZ11_014623 [Volvox africanus]